MKELSLNILDIAKNSVKAKATLIEIDLLENDDTLIVTITDNGCGMKEEMLRNVTDPFCTTRTTRKVGMGLPLYKLCAEQTGGSLSIESRHIDEFPENHGTKVVATFKKNHIDYTPLGDIISSIVTLIQGLDENCDLLFTHTIGEKQIRLYTKELKEVLGEDVPLSNPEVVLWIQEFLKENYK